MVKTQQAILRKRYSAVGWFGLDLPYYLVVQAIKMKGSTKQYREEFKFKVKIRGVILSSTWRLKNRIIFEFSLNDFHSVN